MASRDAVVIGGGDSQLEVDVAAALDGVGSELGTRSFRTTPAGHRARLPWLRRFGTVVKSARSVPAPTALA